MSEGMLEQFTPEEKKRFAAIEGRPDLFETKLLRISSSARTEDEGKKVLVTSRDPGSGNALVPVMKELQKDPRIEMDVITDGRAQDIIQQQFESEDVTPAGGALDAITSVGKPSVILMDRSSEMGIDTTASATYPEVPKILVEDYYMNTLGYLEALRTRGLPYPEKICVMDAGAKEIIMKRFPEMEDRIEVTGQPGFDRITNEDTEGIAREVRGRLHIPEGAKLISFMSTMDEPEKVMEMADQLKKAGGDFYFVFRRHPRDNVPYETYRKILTDAGITVVDTHDFTTDEIGAASDVVLTTWSIEGLYGIYRRKPTAHIVDRTYAVPESLESPMVPVKLGASVEVDHISKLAEVLPDLMDPESKLNTSLREKMESEYPADGKNAERVANVVREYTKSARSEK